MILWNSAWRSISRRSVAQVSESRVLLHHVADDLHGADDPAVRIPVGPRREDLHPEDVPVRQPDIPKRALGPAVLVDIQDDAVLAGLLAPPDRP